MGDPPVRYLGRIIVTECPEGIARKFSQVVAEADLAIDFGLPGTLPPEQQDHRFMQSAREVKDLRAEER